MELFQDHPLRQNIRSSLLSWIGRPNSGDDEQLENHFASVDSEYFRVYTIIKISLILPKSIEFSLRHIQISYCSCTILQSDILLQNQRS